MNLIVGANNVGKSSLLNCIPARFGGEPHRSIVTLPARDETLDPTSSADFVIVASGDEVRKAILRAGKGERYFPWPRDTHFARANADKVIERLLAADEINFLTTAQASIGNGSPSWAMTSYPVTRLYDPLIESNGQHAMVTADFDIKSRLIKGTNAGPRSPNDDFGLTLAQILMSSVHKFDAERLTIGECPAGTNAELSSTASNLAEVLSNLQSNPYRFNEYCELVREVLPTIQAISVRPPQGKQNYVEILVWQVDPKLQRDDLAMPLRNCGTGVGQVLAILYVAKTSEFPRTIVIDEPGSFLHPGASRALIGILRRFTNHQYIVSTHSPEIISELSDIPVTIIKWTGSQSAVEQAPKTTSDVASAALTEIGAKLGDVFGFDDIFWVEGQSDAESLKLVFKAVGKALKRTAILPVRDTGSFDKKRSIAEVLDIYKRLSLGDALLPPALLFLFDREGRSEKEMADAVRQSDGKVQFLARRMFENYLLDANALAALYNELGKDFSITTTKERVESWIAARGEAFLPPKVEISVGSADWLGNVHGAKLIDRLFGELSDERLVYRKTLHMPKLTSIVLEHDVTKLAIVVSEVDRVITH